jgi:DNA-binding MarR family transcriptional regulator
MARRLVAARLITLMKVLYRSAGPAYRAETRLSDFEWRVMMQVGDHGPVVLTALAALLHQDKGQVSHAVKGLVNAKLLSREHLRAPIALTKSGRALFERIVKLGRARNAVLVRELTDTERRALPQILTKLQANARAMLAQEQALRTSAEDPDDEELDEDEIDTQTGDELESAAQPGSRPTGTGAQRLVAQDLFALHNLLQRSAALTYRRTIQLSDFEWRVLSQVGEQAPLTLIQLVPLLSRDKSQVGRTLTRLEERGLITREKIGGGRHILVGISEAGRQLYERLAEIALARNAALVAGLSGRDHQSLMTIFDKLTTSAAMLLPKREKM